MTGIRLKLADAVNKDRSCIGHESPSAREGFQHQCCSYRPNPHHCCAPLICGWEEVALSHIFYSVIDSRTLVRKKAASGYYPKAPPRERCSLRGSIGRGGKDSIYVIIPPGHNFLGGVQKSEANRQQHFVSRTFLFLWYAALGKEGDEEDSADDT